MRSHFQEKLSGMITKRLFRNRGQKICEISRNNAPLPQIKTLMQTLRLSSKCGVGHFFVEEALWGTPDLSAPQILNHESRPF